MAKQIISIVRGTTNTFSISIYDENGDIYTLTNGEILRFGVTKKPGDSQYIFSKEIAEANTNGEYVFTVDVTDTADLPFGEYCYDVGLQSGTDYFNVIPASPFVVARNVTHWEGD